MMQLQSLILTVYALLSLVLPLKCRFIYKIPLALFVIFCGAKRWIYAYAGGSWFDPQLPFYFMVLLEILYAALIIAVFCALVKDLCALGCFLAVKAMHDKWRWRTNIVNGAIAALALVQGGIGVMSQFEAPEIKVQRVLVKNLPAALAGTRLVQLSDLHIGPLLKADFLAEVVERVNALQPDAVLLTGDYVDGSVSELAQEFTSLKDLKAPSGVYAVTGNHEYYSGFAAWEPVFASLGLRFLHNEAVKLNRNDADLYIAGVPDSGAQPQQALKNVPDEAYTVLLSHRPAYALQAQGADLVLSGHTHGGTMFFLQPLIGYFNADFVQGWYDVDDRRLYVSSGTGIWSGFSGRVGVPAEITCFILLPDSA